MLLIEVASFNQAPEGCRVYQVEEEPAKVLTAVTQPGRVRALDLVYFKDEDFAREHGFHVGPHIVREVKGNQVLIDLTCRGPERIRLPMDVFCVVSAR